MNIKDTFHKIMYLLADIYKSDNIDPDVANLIALYFKYNIDLFHMIQIIWIYVKYQMNY